MKWLPSIETFVHVLIAVLIINVLAQMIPQFGGFYSDPLGFLKSKTGG